MFCIPLKSPFQVSPTALNLPLQSFTNIPDKKTFSKTTISMLGVIQELLSSPWVITDKNF